MPLSASSCGPRSEHWHRSGAGGGPGSLGQSGSVFRWPFRLHVGPQQVFQAGPVVHSLGEVDRQVRNGELSQHRQHCVA
jgi:hypothetical protein